ncbi:hypothetical protein CRYUN_Cryun07bG0102000 [Craigia yunnanensis]
MESSVGNQDAHVLAYILELIKMIQTFQEMMLTLEENNKHIMETISKFPFSTTTSQV